MNGEEIRKKRKELGLTQKKLAEKLGISYQTLNGYENGNTIPDTKIELLRSILYQNFDTDIIQEPPTEYKTIDKKLRLKMIDEEILQRRKNIKMQTDKNIIELHERMITLLNEEKLLLTTPFKENE